MCSPLLPANNTTPLAPLIHTICTTLQTLHSATIQQLYAAPNNELSFFCLPARSVAQQAHALHILAQVTQLHERFRAFDTSYGWIWTADLTPYLRAAGWSERGLGAAMMWIRMMEECHGVLERHLEESRAYFEDYVESVVEGVEDGSSGDDDDVD